MIGNRRAESVGLDAIDQPCAIQAVPRIANALGLDQLQARAEDAAGPLLEGRCHQHIAADQRRHQGQRLELVVVQRRLGIALGWAVGVVVPDPVQLRIQPLRFFTGDPERLVVDLRPTDQPRTDHVRAQAHHDSPRDQVVTQGIPRTGDQHIALAAVQVSTRTAQARDPTGHTAEHA